jgi:hypothetical protein
LQFHHIDGDDKLASIGNKGRTWSEKKILEEIAKCLVLCGNCHAKLHYDERLA